MPKVILFAIFWGLFWESIIFNFTGFYLLPAFVAAAFLFYSPLIVKAANILIAGAILWITMFLWSFIISDFHAPSASFNIHILFYTAFTLAFLSSIYVFEEKE